jgi:Ca-activated chloride channel family protein
MHFAEPQFLSLAVVVPVLLAALLWWGARVRRRLRAQFVPPRLLEVLLVGWSAARERGRLLLLTAACACLLLALARPQWGYTVEEVRQRGLDIVVAVDVSRSMLAADVPPNRLTRAKLAVQDLLRVARTDRFALVAFAGSAVVLCPLTWDDAAFLQSLDALEVGTVSDSGTSLAAALQAAERAFSAREDNYRVVVLLTDGEDHEGGALEAARRLGGQGIRLITVGVGTPEGDLIRVRDARGREDYVRDEAGQVVKSRLVEGLLRQMAEATPGGFYLPLQGPRVMETLYERGLADLPRREGTERFVRRLRDRYHWPLAMALVLTAVEWLWPERHRRGGRRGVPASVLVFWLLGISGLTPAWAASAARGLREYEKGHYDAARREFEALLEKRPADERLRFNAGASAYRQGRFDEAATYFEEASRSQDLRLQEWSYYNRGNSLYRLGETETDLNRRRALWEEALRQYMNALRLNTNNADAQYNLEFVRKRLEELPPPSQQQQPSSGDEQNQQPQRREGPSGQQEQGAQSRSEPSANPDSGQDQDRKEAARSGEPQGSEQQALQPPEARERGPSGREESEGNRGAEERSGRPDRMTPEEAERLLDTLRGDERRLPPEKTTTRGARSRSRKDW